MGNVIHVYGLIWRIRHALGLYDTVVLNSMLSLAKSCAFEMHLYRVDPPVTINGKHALLIEREIQRRQTPTIQGRGEVVQLNKGKVELP